VTAPVSEHRQGAAGGAWRHVQEDDQLISQHC